MPLVFSRLGINRSFRSSIINNYTTMTRAQSENRTIFALSTPPGKGGIAVIRVSGPETSSAWSRVLKPLSKRGSFPTPRVIHRCLIVSSLSNGTEEILDDGLAIFFKAPKSFTTEDVLELHVHSSPAVLRRVLGELSSIPGFRPAERGEFTKRAYLAGRLSLLQSEGLRNLIDAETESQRRIAMQSFTGETDTKLEELRLSVVKALAMIEALIDFGEEEDIKDDVYEAARQEVIRLRSRIISELSDHRRGEILRSGIKIAIFGPPNVGKSSLLNYLTRRDAAIVTDIPGTTRDVLETSLDLAGVPVKLFDTAGLRSTDDQIEKIGIQRAHNAVAESNLTLCVLSLPEFLKDGRIPEAISPLITSETLYLLNKNDLVGKSELELHHVPGLGLRRNVWIVSLVTGCGMSDFLSDLGGILTDKFDLRGDEIPLVTENRHRVHLKNTVSYLDAFLSLRHDAVLSAEELRYASKEIGNISGRVDAEDVLDMVFKEFCIGK